MDHAEHTSLHLGELARGHSCAGVPGSDEGRAEKPGSHGRMANGVRSVSIQPPLDPLYLEPGFLICGDCDGDPNQYLIDFEEPCPCGGSGIVADPDFIDGDARGFDPHREYGTRPRLSGNGRGQL